jgi:hypothetical protein
MRYLLLQTLFTVLVATLAASSSFSQTIQAEQIELTKLEQRLTEQKTTQVRLQQQLDQKESELAGIDNQDSPEAQTMEAARQEMQRAQRVFAAEATETNEAKLKNEEFKFALAERKYKKVNETLFDLKEEVVDLKQQLAESANITNNLNQQIADQRLTIEKTRSQIAAQNQAQLEQQKRLDSEQANAEILRLKAELEQKELDEQKRIAALEAIKAESEQLKQQVAVATASAQPQTSQIQTTVPDQGNAIFLSTRQQVESEELHLKTILANTESIPTTDKTLQVTMLRNSTKNKTITLEPLGHELYKVQTKLFSGDSVFEVDSVTWQQYFELGLGGETCIVVLDNSDSSKPRLIYYPSKYSSL